MVGARTLRRASGCVIALLAAVTLTGTAGPASAAGHVRPHIERPFAYGAPIGEQGGVRSPYGSCSSGRVQPRVRWTLTSAATGESHTYRWRGAYPSMYFPRVDVGSYRSRTTVRCGDQRLTRRHVLEVVQKTEATTISRAEFDQLHRGMTPAEVTTIVGTAPTLCSPAGRREFCQIDDMEFWSWSALTFRDGHLVGKIWDIEHD